MSVPTPILQYTLSDATMKELLPVGYTPLAYIESSGTQYIDTGQKLASTDTIYTKVRWTEIGNYTLFSSKESSGWLNGKYLGLSYYNEDKIHYSRGSTVSSSTSSTRYHANVNDSYEIILKGSENKIIYNGTVITGSGNCLTTNLFTCDYNMFLFAANGGGTANLHDRAKIYYFIATKSDGLLRLDLRPARRDSDGVIGMYDLVSRTFKTNSGSGSFIAGPELAIGKGGGKSLPEEYLLVEYLESTGILWINTGYIPNNTSGIYLKAYCTTSNGNHTVIGCRLDSGDTRWWINYSATLELSWNSWTNTISNYTNTWTEIKHNYMNNRSANVNGTNYSVNYPTLANITYSAYLFKGNGPNVTTSTFEGKISNVKITEGTTTVRNMYPCYRKSDMKPGMYDTVNGVFYINAGSGEFILGPSITNCYTWEPNCKSPNFCIGYNQGQEVTLNTYNSTGSFTQFLNNLFAITDYSLTVNRTYTISFDAISPNGTSELRLYNSNNTPRYFYYSTNLGNVTTSWQHYSYTFTSSDRGSGDAVLHPIEIYAPSKTEVKIRNLSIYEGSIDWSTVTNRNGLYTNLSGIYDSSKGWVASGSNTSASYIEFDKSIMNTRMTAKTFTIAFWFRVHNTNRHILFGNATTSYPLNIEYGSSKIRYYFASTPDLNGSTSISINTWYHFVLSVTSTGFKGYINGNIDANYTSAPTFTQYTGNLRIGSDWRVDSGNNIFMGADISNFMIFDTALTEAQVKELYGK